LCQSGRQDLNLRPLRPEGNSADSYNLQNHDVIEGSDDDRVSVAPDVAPTIGNLCRDSQESETITDLIDMLRVLDADDIETLRNVARGLKARAMIDNPTDANTGNR